MRGTNARGEAHKKIEEEKVVEEKVEEEISPDEDPVVDLAAEERKAMEAAAKKEFDKRRAKVTEKLEASVQKARAAEEYLRNAMQVAFHKDQKERRELAAEVTGLPLGPSTFRLNPNVLEEHNIIMRPPPAVIKAHHSLGRSEGADKIEDYAELMKRSEAKYMQSTAAAEIRHTESSPRAAATSRSPRILETESKSLLPDKSEKPAVKSSERAWLVRMSEAQRDEEKAILQRMSDTTMNYLRNPRLDQSLVLREGGRPPKSLVSSVQFRAFAATPSVIEFTAYEAGRYYEATLSLRNVSGVTQRLFLLAPHTAEFALIHIRYPGMPPPPTVLKRREPTPDNAAWAMAVGRDGRTSQISFSEMTKKDTIKGGRDSVLSGTRERIKFQPPRLSTMERTRAPSPDITHVPLPSTTTKILAPQYTTTSLENSGNVAPGMTVLAKISFAPDSLADFRDCITVQTELDKYEVEIRARRDPPQLSLPFNLDCGYCLDRSRKVVEFKCTNGGGPARFRFVEPAVLSTVLDMSRFNFSIHDSISSVGSILRSTTITSNEAKAAEALTLQDTGSELTLYCSDQQKDYCENHNFPAPIRIWPSVFELESKETTTISIEFSPVAEALQSHLTDHQPFPAKFFLVCNNGHVEQMSVTGRSCAPAVKLDKIDGREIDQEFIVDGHSVSDWDEEEEEETNETTASTGSESTDIDTDIENRKQSFREKRNYAQSTPMLVSVAQKKEMDDRLEKSGTAADVNIVNEESTEEDKSDEEKPKKKRVTIADGYIVNNVKSEKIPARMKPKLRKKLNVASLPPHASVQAGSRTYPISFPGRSVGATSEKTVTIANVAPVALDFSWNFKPIRTERGFLLPDRAEEEALTDSGGENAFSISPSSGVIKPKSKLDFKITFSPSKAQPFVTVVQFSAENVPVKKKTQENSFSLAGLQMVHMRLQGEGKACRVDVQPGIVYVPGSICVNVPHRRAIEVSNHSDSQINVEWDKKVAPVVGQNRLMHDKVSVDGDSDLLGRLGCFAADASQTASAVTCTMKPVRMTLLPGECRLVECSIVCSKPGPVSVEISGNVSPGPTVHPLRIMIQATVKGPAIQIKGPDLDFGLIQARDTMLRTLTMKNLSPAPAMWQLVPAGSQRLAWKTVEEQLLRIQARGRHTSMMQQKRDRVNTPVIENEFSGRSSRSGVLVIPSGSGLVGGGNYQNPLNGRPFSSHGRESGVPIMYSPDIDEVFHSIRALSAPFGLPRIEFAPQFGVLAPNAEICVHTSFSPQESGKVSTHIECHVLHGNTQFIALHALVQAAGASFVRKSGRKTGDVDEEHDGIEDLGVSWVGIPQTRDIVVKNHAFLPTKFSWIDTTENELYSLSFSPDSGLLPPGSEMVMTATLIPKKRGYLRCQASLNVGGVKEPLSIRLDTEARGLAVAVSVVKPATKKSQRLHSGLNSILPVSKFNLDTAAKSTDENDGIPVDLNGSLMPLDELDRLCAESHELNFGKACPIFVRQTAEIELRNYSPIQANYVIRFSKFGVQGQTMDEPDGNTALSFDLGTKLNGTSTPNKLESLNGASITKPKNILLTSRLRAVKSPANLVQSTISPGMLGGNVVTARGGRGKSKRDTELMPGRSMLLSREGMGGSMSQRWRAGDTVKDGTIKAKSITELAVTPENGASNLYQDRAQIALDSQYLASGKGAALFTTPACGVLDGYCRKKITVTFVSDMFGLYKDTLNVDWSASGSGGRKPQPSRLCVKSCVVGCPLAILPGTYGLLTSTPTPLLNWGTMHTNPPRSAATKVIRVENRGPFDLNVKWRGFEDLYGEKLVDLVLDIPAGAGLAPRYPRIKLSLNPHEPAELFSLRASIDTPSESGSGSDMQMTDFTSNNQSLFSVFPTDAVLKARDSSMFEIRFHASESNVWKAHLVADVSIVATKRPKPAAEPEPEPESLSDSSSSISDSEDEGSPKKSFRSLKLGMVTLVEPEKSDGVLFERMATDFNTLTHYSGETADDMVSVHPYASLVPGLHVPNGQKTSGKQHSSQAQKLLINMQCRTESPQLDLGRRLFKFDLHSALKLADPAFHKRIALANRTEAVVKGVFQTQLPFICRIVTSSAVDAVSQAQRHYRNNRMNSTTSLPFSVQPKQSWDIVGSFVPSPQIRDRIEDAEYEGNLVIEFDNGSQQLVPLKARWRHPVIELSDSVLDFGQIHVATPRRKQLKLVNPTRVTADWSVLMESGGGRVPVTDLTGDGEENPFRFGHISGQLVGCGGLVPTPFPLTVTFAPSQPGHYERRFEISVNHSGNSCSLLCKGNATLDEEYEAK